MYSSLQWDLWLTTGLPLLTFRCQFHQHFYVQIFHTNVVSAAFSRYVLALNKLLYKKCARIMLMKLTPGQQQELPYLLMVVIVLNVNRLAICYFSLEVDNLVSLMTC